MTSSDADHPSSLAVFDRHTILIALAILFVAAWFGQRPIAVIAGLLVACAGSAAAWSRYCLRRVTYERSLSADHAFPGEQVELTIALVNRKPLPVPWLKVDDLVPAAVRPASDNWQADGASQVGILTHIASLLWYRRATWRYQLSCRRRGCYLLGPAKISGGDPLGLYTRERPLQGSQELVVYPRLIPLEQLHLLARQPLGEMRARQLIFEDPSRLAGVREYRTSDPLKRIHWQATAKRQQLHTRVYEPTTTLQTTLALNVEGFAGDGAEDLFEHAVSVAASLANLAIGQRQAVGLLINAGIVGGESCSALRPAAGNEALMRILELLARLSALTRRPFVDFLREEAGRLPWGTTIAVISRQVDGLLVELATELRRQGRPVTICPLGSTGAA